MNKIKREDADILLLLFTHKKKWGCMGAGLQDADADEYVSGRVLGGPLMGETPTS